MSKVVLSKKVEANQGPYLKTVLDENILNVSGVPIQATQPLDDDYVLDVEGEYLLDVQTDLYTNGGEVGYPIQEA